MSKTIETGHAKNVENFTRLQTHLISFGSKYAPADPRMQLPNIAAIKQNSAVAMEAVSAAMPASLQAISRREVAFDGIPQLASRALHIAETLHLDKATINALKELVRKLYGRRAVPKQAPEDPAPEHKNISVSQLSFDQRIAHLDQFINILGAEPAYQPAEPDLTIPSLLARLNEMRASNEAVTQASIPLAEARAYRDNILYAKLTGLVDVALDVKKYVRAAFGSNSPEYKEIKALEFKKV